MIPAKRPAPSDTEPFRLSRSMTADDPINRHLLLDHASTLSIPPSSRRRVNPDSLAIRLGPELVAELESYVQPGVIEMPSFAIRQGIQIRHNVDRRHIYDWFHSRGLRVTKEDKRATVEQKTDAMRVQRLRQMRRSIPTAHLSTSRSSPLSKSPPIATVPVSLPQPTLCLVEYSTADPPIPCRWSSVSADHLLAQVTSASDGSSRPPPGASRTFRDPRIDDVFLIHEDITLGEVARKSCYETLSRVLGPAVGVQECVGTYGAYMAKQLESCLLPPDNMSTASSNSPASPGRAHLSDLNFAPGKVDCISTSETVPTTDSDCFEDHASASMNFQSASATEVTVCLDLCDVLASPLLLVENGVPAQPSQPKTVSFVPDDRGLLNFSSLFVSSAKGSFFQQSSSSLAGALGESSSPTTSRAHQDARRKHKEWTRPQMGRARAYSSGGAM